MVTEDSLPNIIKTIKKRRIKENYQKILTDYIKTNSDILPIKTKEIHSSFFQNINNAIIVNKKEKLKNLILKQNNTKIQKNLKIIFIKWKSIPKESIENNKQININSNFFDSCLSLDGIRNDDINKNKSNIDYSINNISRNKNEISKNIIAISNDSQIVFTNKAMNMSEKSIDFGENFFPKYNDKNNDSLIMNKDLTIKGKGIYENNGKVDDFNVKINEDIIITNSKRKSDILDSQEINDSLNDQNISLDDNICNICNNSIEKEAGTEKILIKEKDKRLESIEKFNINDNSAFEINELCNLSIKEKEIINNSIMNDLREKNNYNNEKVLYKKIE